MFKKLFGRSGAGDAGRAGNVPQPPTTFGPLKEMAWNHVQALMQGHESWGLSRASDWAVDLSGGEISWTFANGRVARAPGELIATWSGRGETLLWGWNHPSAPPGSAVAAGKVKAFADLHGISELQVAERGCGFDEGWELTAIAALLGNLQGVYRGEAGPGTWAYIGFGGVTLSKG